jgi:hypothetical protein
MGALANEYAAMPSLHVAWALWAGWLIIRHAKHSVFRVLGASYPVFTTFVVMATGNHYLLDVVAGAAVLAFGYLVGQPLPRLTPRRGSYRLRVATGIDSAND